MANAYDPRWATPPVAALPAAAGNDYRVRAFGGRPFWSDGTQWHDLIGDTLAMVDGGSFTDHYVSAPFAVDGGGF